MSVAAHEIDDSLPAWSLPATAGESIRLPASWPERVTREWAYGGATGAGVRVCVLDSGVELDHPLVGTVQRSVAVTREGDELVIADDEAGDLCGHGTACAGIIRSLAPDCELTSVRVLGEGYTGSAAVLLGGLEWAIGQGFHVVNMSLSTTKKQYAEQLHELADAAYFKRTMLVASAHNMPVESFPWRFASVVSVGSHEETDPLRTSTTRRRRWSSSRAGCPSKSHGSAARRSTARGTASRRRTSPACARSSSASIRS
ncbi:MAG TPA: S8 family serine peptidase [Gaiellaceae bacterium]|nr:S8 family serine peptidase [Gaiellaceae bacterium]